MRALFIDARNDALVGGLAVVGFFAARYGWPKLDAYLALPTGLWIGYAGIDLALENIRLLMGEAPAPARREELLAIARKLPGIQDAHDLRAHFIGTLLQVHLHVAVDPNLTVRRSHDIGEGVRRRLEQESDVGSCAVHLDPGR